MDLNHTAYALDSTTIDLSLSLFPWAPFRTTKAAVKLHTLLDLRGAIPSFIPISDGKLHDVNVLDLLLPEAGAFYVMDRGYLDFARLYALDQAGSFFVTRAKKTMVAQRRYSHPVDRTTGVIFDQTLMLQGCGSLVGASGPRSPGARGGVLDAIPAKAAKATTKAPCRRSESGPAFRRTGA